MDSIEIRGLRLRGRFGVAAAERAAEAIVGFLHQEEDQQTECR